MLKPVCKRQPHVFSPLEDVHNAAWTAACTCGWVDTLPMKTGEIKVQCQYKSFAEYFFKLHHLEINPGPLD